VTAVILRRFGLQEHDTCTTLPVSALLWNNRECGEGLMDVKSDGADVEKVWCAGA